MEPAGYLQVLARRWRIVVGMVLLGLSAAFLMPDPAKPVPLYRATSTLLLVPESVLVPGAQNANAQGNLIAIGALAGAGEVPRRVADALGATEEPNVLARRVKINVDGARGSISFVVTGRNRVQAAQLADAFAEQLLAFLDERQQEVRAQQIDDTLERIRTLQAEMADAEARFNAGGPRVDVARVERDAAIRQYGAAYERLQQLNSLPPPSAGLAKLSDASVEAVPLQQGLQAASKQGVRLLISAAAGLLFGSGLALLADRQDPRIYTREAAEAAFGLPVITEIPRTRRRHKGYVSVVADRDSPWAGAYRTLRTAVTLMQVMKPTPVVASNGKSTGGSSGHSFHFVPTNSWPAERRRPLTPDPQHAGEAAPNQHPRVLVVTSPGAKDGKTTVAANLAASFAHAGKVVLVLSCDFNRPEIHRLLGVDGSAAGLSDLLVDPGRTVDDLIHYAVPTTVANVWLAPPGTSLDRPTELLAHGRALLARAGMIAEIVIVDTGPLLLTSEAAELAPGADAVLLVARAGHTAVDAAALSTELLGRLAAPLLGVVLIDASGPGLARRRYYRRPARLGRKEPAKSAVATNVTRASVETRPANGPISGNGSGKAPLRSGSDSTPRSADEG